MWCTSINAAAMVLCVVVCQLRYCLEALLKHVSKGVHAVTTYALLFSGAEYQETKFLV